jgi:hypothetical protein
MAHFCHAPVTSFSAYSKGTPPVKVIRRNSHFFDCRHIDIEAQSKRDQQTKKNKHTCPSTARTAHAINTWFVLHDKTGDT